MAAKGEISRHIKALTELLAKHPEGLGIDEIAKKAGLDLPRRTLQRRLEGSEQR